MLTSKAQRAADNRPGVHAVVLEARAVVGPPTYRLDHTLSAGKCAANHCKISPCAQSAQYEMWSHLWKSISTNHAHTCSVHLFTNSLHGLLQDRE